MNFYFWAAMLGMLLVAIAIIVWPLLKRSKTASLAYRESNLRLHEEKLKELDLDLSEERIDPEQYRVARLELDKELLGDIPAESRENADIHYGTESGKKPALALVVAIFIPALTFLVYMQLGMHASSEMVDQGTSSQQKSIEEMTAKLEARLRESGGDIQEWTMLGRALKYMGRYADAADAFAAAVSMEPSAQLMLEQAEALALENGHRFDIKSRELVLDALRLEPDDVNALWFAGVVEYQFGNYRLSIKHLSRLSGIAADDEEVNNSVRLYLQKSREQLIAKGEKVPEVDELMKTNSVKDTGVSELGAKPVARLQVKVDVDAKVREQFSDNDTVFVYAKAVKGPRLPLAVQKIELAKLPATVVLDDSMAMVAGMNLSAFPNVVLSARISRSGSAIAQSGDYIGEVVVNDVNSTELFQVNIDQLVQ